MLNKPKVSVIIPVYNVAPFIERCAKSIFEQSLKSLEIIFVDDCSPDNSVDIINKVLFEYPERQKQTLIIRNSINKGLAESRKNGILKANGDFIIHCDGDDWIDKDLYEKMLISAIKNGADIVFCDEMLEYKNKSVYSRTQHLPISGKELMKKWHKEIYGLFCHNKLVKAELYKEYDILPWEGLNMWEDNGLFARLLYHADKISQIYGPVYHYNRSNINAMTSGYGIKQVEQMLGIAKNLSIFFESKPDADDFKDTINAFKYLARINLITDSFTNYKRFLKTFPESSYITKKLDPKAFSIRGRFRFNMVRHGLSPLFILLFKIRNFIK